MTSTAPTPPPTTSRLCVKGLPKHISEQRLRALFAEHGDVTDCRLLRTADGKSRQMAFIGYKTVAQAQTALAMLHKSYLDTSRLTVEVARQVGEEDPEARPWSKYSKGSSAHQRSLSAGRT